MELTTIRELFKNREHIWIKKLQLGAGFEVFEIQRHLDLSY